jgi:hypothetical protein
MKTLAEIQLNSQIFEEEFPSSSGPSSQEVTHYYSPSHKKSPDYDLGALSKKKHLTGKKEEIYTIQESNNEVGSSIENTSIRNW